MRKTEIPQRVREDFLFSVNLLHQKSTLCQSIVQTEAVGCRTITTLTPTLHTLQLRQTASIRVRNSCIFTAGVRRLLFHFPVNCQGMKCAQHPVSLKMQHNAWTSCCESFFFSFFFQIDTTFCHPSQSFYMNTLNSERCAPRF